MEREYNFEEFSARSSIKLEHRDYVSLAEKVERGECHRVLASTLKARKTASQCPIPSISFRQDS